MKKRIAVCFYGKIRREDFFNEDYSKWDSDEYDFDFFIATWEHDFNITLPFVKSNVLNENNFNLKFFSPNARVAKACYLINKVIRLKEEYEMKNGFVYDLVVCTRGDVRQKKFSYFCDALNTTLLTAKLNTSRPIVSVASTIRAIEKENVPTMNLDSDFTFIYNQEGANLHANLYNLIFLQEKNGKYDDLWINNGHYIHGFCFTYHNFITIQRNGLDEAFNE